MNHNLLESLSGIEQFSNLRVFHIKFNFIQDLNEFLKIPNKTLLNSLNFIGNPAESQLGENPNFLNNFINLRSFNAYKESIFVNESTGIVSSGKISKKLHFIDDFNKEKPNYEFTEGLLTGNFNTKKIYSENGEELFLNKKNENYENNENSGNIENNENREKNIGNVENDENDKNDGNEKNIGNNGDCENNGKIAIQNMSFSSEREDDPLFEAHISHIDNDICRLSVIFYEKLLKEKTILGLKRHFLQCYYRENKFCMEFYEKRLKNRGFWLWRRKFVEKLFFRSYTKNLNEISQKIIQKNNDFLNELSVSALNLRGKKQYNLRKITETDQDYIDSNREKEGEVSLNECKVLRENNGINNEGIKERTAKKLGFDEYKEISMKNAKNEKVTEENYRHDLPLSTSFNSKSPYGSV